MKVARDGFNVLVLLTLVDVRPMRCNQTEDLLAEVVAEALSPMNEKVLGILPARGGSKGIPGKNLRNLLGKPLIGWSAEALVGVKCIEKKICCTDDESIAEVARQFGLEVPWIRPSSLAQDDTLVIDVISHAIDRLSSRW